MSLAKLFSTQGMSTQARNMYWASLGFFVIAVVANAIFVYLALQANVWQLYVPIGASLLVVVGGFAGTKLARSGRVAHSAWMLMGSLIIGGMVTGCVVSGTGLVTGLVVIIVVLQIGTQALSPRSSFHALLVSIGAAIISGGLDVLAPDFQYGEPLLRQVILVLATPLILFLAIVSIRQFRTYPLQTKLSFIFLTVTILTVGMIVFFGYFFSQDAFTNQANQTLLAAASQTAARIDDFIDSNLKSIRAEAQLPDWAAYLSLPAAERTDSELAGEVLNNLQALSLRDTVNIVSYGLLDQSGRNVMDTQGAHIDGDESERGYFQTAMLTRSPYVSPVEFLPNTEDALLTFSSPIRNAASNVVGVIRVQYRSTILQRLVEESTGLAGAQSFPSLLDENYIYLAHAADDTQVFRSVAELDVARVAHLQSIGRLPDLSLSELSTHLLDLQQALDNALTQPNFTIHWEGIGETAYAGAIVQLRRAPWFAVFAQPESAFLATAGIQTRGTLLLAVLIAGGVTALAGGVARILVAPLVHLTQTAHQVAAGDLTVQAQVHTADEIGALAESFNAMTHRLHESVATLEQRVADRTRALEITTRVSRRLSTILERHALAVEVVEQVREAFEYYYAQLYLFDETREHLVLVGGSGEIGRQLVERGHRLPQGKGLIGRTADTNAAVLVPNVAQEPDWLPNPLLPDTRAEAAVPISIGDDVVGVLDVQHNVVNGLSQDDLGLLQSIANQVAIALQNARTFAGVQQQATRETLMGDISQRIQNATSVPEALQVAVRELGRALGTQHVGVRLRLAEDETHSSVDDQPVVIEHNGNGRREALK